MLSFVAGRDFVEDSVRNEPIEDFTHSGKRSERFNAIASRVDNLHGRTRGLARVRKEHLPKVSVTMFSAPDMIIVSIVALLLFGPERLPGLMRGAGRVMREVRNTSQSFVAEMERAVDHTEATIETPKPTQTESVTLATPPPTPPSEPSR